MALVLKEIHIDLPFLLKSKTPALLKFSSYVYISDIGFFYQQLLIIQLSFQGK